LTFFRTRTPGRAIPPSATSKSDAGTIEKVLLQDRRLVVLALFSLSALAWAYLVVMARQMAVGDMTLMGMGAPSALHGSNMMGTMTASQMPWSLLTFLLMFIMWSVMMVGMMVPSAAPMVLLFARVQRRILNDQAPTTRIAAFTAGYLLIWTSFSLIATGLQWALTELHLLSPMMESTSQFLAVGVLLAAGIYQLTALKLACLKQCRSPIGFLTSHWKDGISGSLRMGIEHGIFCLGCCWLLMALLFVGGVMNLTWVALIATFVLLEKVVPRGETVGRLGGIMLIVFAGYVASHS
jgi:predicted metal-binding membrane protein